MKSFWQRVDRIEGGLASIGAGLCLFAMMIITVVSVFGRYVVERDILPGAYNMIERIAFPLIVFWAVPMAHREGSFPRFDMLVEALPPALRSTAKAFVLLVELAVFAVVMWYVLRFTWQSVLSGRTMQVGTDFLPVWPVLIMVPLAFALMMLEMCRLLWLEFRRFGSGGDKPEPDKIPAVL